jgi:hypothetical protein
MVQGLKIPKHSGPDGQGLSRNVFDSLISMLSDQTVTLEEAKKAVELCLTLSTEIQWNEEYRPELVKLILDLENN